MECCVCGYVEKNGNTLLRCGKHYMCDECLLSGEALEHDCAARAANPDMELLSDDNC